MEEINEEAATQALIARLEAFLTVASEKGKLGTIRPARQREVEDQIGRQVGSVRRICNELSPGLGDFPLTTVSGAQKAAVAVRTAIGILQDREELEADLRASGVRSAPLLDLSPRVWESARSLWSSGQHNEALHAAWKAINAHLRQRLGRPDLSDDNLVTEAFGPDATKRARLHLPGDKQTDTWRSRQRGLLHLAQACVAGIRHPVAHEADHQIPYDLAVEQLACLSLLSHWIDEAELTAVES
ncbi:MAG TPA: TIGR02391 family protein [Acidimicrobiales bacterium]|nr:TIGR02391 family protein [Acidimicrobiales bacterium]